MARLKTSSRKKTTRPARKKSGGSGSAGRILGLLLVLALLGGGAFLYLNPQALDELKAAAGLAEAPTAASATPATASAAPTAPAEPALVIEADPAAAETLNTAKMMVNMRFKEGKTLTDITEPFKLSAAEKQHWQSVHINQGTISAVHVNSNPEHPMVLLPMQHNGQLAWVCAGDVPAALESVCNK
ncbi:MAG: hypothetical protein Q4A62_02275 [Eikenella sp.]|nr:hypothetical protein [Eikenella sp.]